MTKEETIESVILGASDLSVSEINTEVSNFVMFDRNYTRTMNVGEIVLKNLALEKAIEAHLTGSGATEFSIANDSKKITLGGLQVGIQTHMKFPEMSNLFEIKLRKKLEVNHTLANSILDRDEIVELQTNAEAINKKYNLNFVDLSYWVYLHVLNMDNDESEYYSSELVKNENGNYSTVTYSKDYTASVVFQNSIRRYKTMRKVLAKMEETKVEDGLMRLLKDLLD